MFLDSKVPLLLFGLLLSSWNLTMFLGRGFFFIAWPSSLVLRTERCSLVKRSSFFALPSLFVLGIDQCSFVQRYSYVAWAFSLVERIQVYYLSFILSSWK